MQIIGTVADIFKLPSDDFGALEFIIGGFNKTIDQNLDIGVFYWLWCTSKLVWCVPLTIRKNRDITLTYETFLSHKTI